MSDRISSSSGLRPTTAPQKVAAKATAAPVQKASTDQLSMRGLDQSDAARQILGDNLPLPPKPKKAADLKAWLGDAYSRLLKAEQAFDALKRSPGIDRDATSKAWFALRDAHHQVDRADKGGAVKKEFFAGVVPQAQQLIDSLADFPEPPADAAGKKEWLAKGRMQLAQAKTADGLIQSAWFDFKAVDFDQRGDASSKLFDFESRLRRVEYELNPPAPRPSSGTRPNGSQPLFGLTQGASELANSDNAVGQVAGAVALPIALTIDTIDLLTRPFQWLDSLGKK